MKMLFDLFPVLVFFIAYKMNGIFFATMAVLVATFVQVALHWVKHHRIEKMHLLIFGLIVLLGGATLLLEDEIYIKWKPTVVYWILGMVLLTSRYIWNKQLLAGLIGRNISLPPNVWDRLTVAWVVFLFSVGITNLFIVYHFDTDTWVNFKLFGVTSLMLIFLVTQGAYIAGYVMQTKKNHVRSKKAIFSQTAE